MGQAWTNPQEPVRARGSPEGVGGCVLRGAEKVQGSWLITERWKAATSQLTSGHSKRSHQLFLVPRSSALTGIIPIIGTLGLTAHAMFWICLYLSDMSCHAELYIEPAHSGFSTPHIRWCNTSSQILYTVHYKLGL